MVFVLLAVADAPSGRFAIALTPPAVEDAEVESSVDGRLHTGRAAGLKRSAGGVQPDVRPLKQVTRQMHVVIFKEHKALADGRAVGELEQLFDEVLALIVTRMGLAGKNELNRAAGVVDDGLQALGVLNQQESAFVGSESARERDGQDVRVKGFFHRFENLAGSIAALILLDQPFPAGAHQARTVQFVSPPELFIVYLIDALDVVRALGTQKPIRPEVAVEEVSEFMRHERGDVHAVGDVRNRYFLHRPARPEVRPHAPGDTAVQLADAVAIGSELDAQNEHGKRPVLRGSPGLAPRQQLLVGRSQPVGQGFEIGFDHVCGELVVAGCNRRMRRENGGARDDFQCNVQADFFLFNDLCQAFQARKGTMPFIHVNDFGLDPHRLQGAHAADSQQHLLGQPDLGFGRVKPRRDLPVLRRVFQNIGVEQEKGYATDENSPDNGVDGSVRTADGHPDFVAGLVPHALDRQAEEIGLGIGFLLPPLVVEELAEISLPVHKPDAYQRQARVGGGLQVVPGQDAEAAGEQRQALVQAEFHGEIGNMFAGCERHVECYVGAMNPFFKQAPDAFEVADITGVPGKLFQTTLRNPGQKGDRVAAALGPQAGVDAPEKLDGVPGPAPPHVAGQGLKKSKVFWNVRLNLVRFEASHNRRSGSL